MSENINIELANLILTETFNLNYSVVGYEDEGIPISETFTHIKNKCVENSVDITFISFADTELKGNKIDEWVVETDKGKFYYAPIFKNGVRISNDEDERLVNDYYFFKIVLSETAPQESWEGTDDEHALLSNPRSAQLAYVLDNSFIYRIRCTNCANENLEIKYEDNVLIVTIPKEWLEFENTNSNADKTRPYTTIKYDEKKCLYEGESDEKPTNSKNTKDFPSNQADIEKLKDYITTISKQLRDKNVPIKKADEGKNDIYAEGFARLILSLAYLSKLMSNCWIESIPSVVANIAKKPRCLGVFIWGYPNKYTSKNFSESPYSIYFKLLADKLCACYANKYIKPLNTALQVRKEAIKAAKSAIIARNLSHNLGSHVMFYIKQKLESVQKILRTGVLKNVIEAKNLAELKETIRSHGEELPFLVGLGRFLNYLQERQDFIATVATDYIPYRATINFKDAIYDELKPEKRAQRHKTPESTGTMPDNLLLDYIAYSEGFHPSDHIELWFGDSFNGGNEPKDVPSGLREFNVALPGGNMGRQAFFSIMENIIRNTAKHDGNKATGNTLKFRFIKLEAENIKDVLGYTLRQKEIHETKEGYYLKEGEQDKENLKPLDLDNNQTIFSKHQNDLFYLGITVELEGDAQNAIDKIKKGLRRTYITSDGQMDEECKGLKEIRISAAWLRGKELDDEIPIDEPPAISIRKTDKNYLQYIVCLPRPKNVAFVKNITLDDSHTIENEYEKLKKDGCRVFSKEEKVQDIAVYDLVVFANEIDEKKRHEIQSHIGSRILECDEKDMNTIIESKNIIEEAYKEWLNKLLGPSLPKISILDSSGTDITQTDSVKGLINQGGTSENTDDYYANCIVFNSHYPGQAEKKAEDRLLYAKANFVEAISGGNSTDRLTRRDKRDYEWYAKHVIAGRTKVAIFDERIYDMIMPKGNIIAISEEDKLEIKNRTSEFHNTFVSRNDDFLSLLKFVKKELDTTDDNIAISILNSSNYLVNYNPVELANKIIEYKEQPKQLDYSLAWKYRESGIWVFNIKRVDKKWVQLIGYDAPVTNPIGLYQPTYQAKVIATIKNNGTSISIDPETNDWKKFDIITIHQGILDKIYSTFEIKKEEKTKVTERLFEYFSNKTKITEGNEVFLPQFIIHSGRSKPNKEDMPQKQPFLQFSALDHALRDCKFTLTELLYSAHYEQSDNNN